MEYPDAKKHQLISFIKSFIRILGYKFVKKASRIDAIANIINKNDVSAIATKIKLVIELKNKYFI